METFSSSVFKKKERVIVMLTLLFFAIRGINDGMLAFASTSYMPVYAIAMTIISYCCIPLGFIYFMSGKRMERKNFPLLLFPIIYFLFLIFNTYKGFTGNWATSFIVISCFLLFKEKDKARVYHFFRKIVIITCYIAVPVYLMYLSGFRSLFSTVPYYNNDVLYYKKVFIFGILEEGSLPRLCSIFNEPGGLGTTCAFVFVISHKRNRLIENVFLILSIVCSFSLAGFIVVLLYAVLKLLRKNIKNIIWIVLIVALVISLPKIDFHNEQINAFFERLSITETGLQGDDRTSISFNSFFNSFLTSDKRFFGYGAGFRTEFGESTYKQIILEFGIVGFAVILLTLLILSLYKANWNYHCICLIMVFLASIYQRPLAISSIYGFILLFGGIAYIQTFETSIIKKASIHSKRLKMLTAISNNYQ